MVSALTSPTRWSRNPVCPTYPRTRRSASSSATARCGISLDWRPSNAAGEPSPTNMPISPRDRACSSPRRISPMTVWCATSNRTGCTPRSTLSSSSRRGRPVRFAPPSPNPWRPTSQWAQVPPGCWATTTTSAPSPATARRSRVWTSRIPLLPMPRSTAHRPMFLWDGVAPARQSCSNSPFLVAPTSTRARSSVCQRWKISPTTSCRIPPGSVLNTRTADVTAVASRFRGAVPRPLTDGRQRATPGFRCRTTGLIGRSRPSRTIRRPS